MKIQHLPPFARPREKLHEKGAQALLDEELLALIMRRGYPGTSVLELARYVLEKYPLKTMNDIPIDSLLELKGFGISHATALLASVELGRRIFEVGHLPTIEGVGDVLHIVSDIRVRRREHFLALFLNARRRLIERQTISIGTIDASIVHPREVYSPAISLRAESIVIVHNHPSGDPHPSVADIKATRRLLKAGEIIGIKILDHIIITQTAHLSMKAEQLL